ncbi:MAG: Mrp/NBP35 family ATP-binding protein [Sulfurovum sp.]|nr:Mrp/NBP35 family ATP-binding protein [Sulfurovum sp.]
MSEKEILKKLQKVLYPGLERSIVDLKVVDTISSEKGKTAITLSVQNDEAFKTVSQRIAQLLGPDVEIKRKGSVAKRDINYGHTANPNNRAPYAKMVIAVTSGKGGVGKSTVSANLSVALAQKGFSVGLLDADVYGPNIPRMLGTAHEKLQWNENDKIVPSENFGIKIMSVGLTTPTADTPLVWRSSVAVSALIQFLEDVAWGELDFLVIDMPPGTGDIQLTMAQELPITAGIIVTTPQQVALDDVSRAIMMFKDINVPIGGLVENMSFFIAPDTKKRYDIFGKGGGEATAVKYNIPFLGEIPLDMKIRELSDEGTPPVAMGDELQKGYYKNIAEKLISQIL